MLDSYQGIVSAAPQVLQKSAAPSGAAGGNITFSAGC
jgi:hypothetical protein